MTKYAQEFIEKLKRDKVEEIRYIQSSSDPNKKYKLMKIEGVWECECIGYQMYGYCKHSKQLTEKNNNEQRNKNNS